MDIKKMVYKLLHSAPILENICFGEHRRYEGQFGNNNEGNGYTSIFFFVEKGLAGHLDVITELVSKLRPVQSDIGEYHVICGAFGWDDNKIRKAENPVKVYGNRMNANYIKTQLEELSGSANDSTRTLPELILHRKVTVDDMVIMICKDNNINFSENFTLQFNRSIQKHTGWIFVNPGSVMEVKYGTIETGG